MTKEDTHPSGVGSHFAHGVHRMPAFPPPPKTKAPPTLFPWRGFRSQFVVVWSSPVPVDFFYSSPGAMIAANALRARFSRDFTVPRLQAVISAISSYDFPSSSRRTKTCR